ncbi:ferredoxin [Mesotoga sp. Brook.08.YT.4.2.5.1]|uniref:NAD(P)/FAD-dependent oxidoreductase n=1 Tax=unclassified Mesotoga TaxID=1184398 RepID=UPI000C1A8605|nr:MULTISPECIES: NAD(P)/FAD-dependent oxidoreductase [unclassified Mesotoga]PNE22750.1 ferredoxin [Mesotoga sp. Brook.08.YT.4.2.5.1]PNS42429.1 ferredoxin [Mesotoga sp. B105.6.4]PVD17613.1 ferredoxin [Mesotoga sp. Brook.08.105.5.1]RAO95906.1 ferredoxin [Mesotoga sp. Brook.08.YT.4.2.5.4.]RDI94263.1 ferredoxin [Mesotoga sp. Brook.08.YT.4.2.5.2.]
MQAVVIGGGVVGSLIARELTRYKIEVVLVEKSEDIGQGVTKANSAILHGGYDDPPDTLRAKLCAAGNSMFTRLSEELKFPVKRTGSLVVARGRDELPRLEELLENGIRNGVEGLRIVEKSELKSLEPYISDEFNFALLCSSAGITEPWMVAISSSINVSENGGKIITSDEVVGGTMRNGRIEKVLLRSGRKLRADLVINAAGVFFERVASSFGVDVPSVKLRKGEYILLDKKASSLVKRIIFPLPTAEGKGRLVVPTVDGGVLLGPTSVELPGFTPEDVSTTYEGLVSVRNSGEYLIPGIDNPGWYVKSFAGLRPETDQKDFYIRKAEELENFITVGAIRSPGLTAAPAIAEYVVTRIVPETGIRLVERDDFVSSIKERERIKELSFERASQLIDKDPAYGRIVCQCNEVSETEVIQAIRDGARTVDGIKFRTRAGFGRCQGGFCSSSIARILARELKKDLSEIRQNNERSWIVSEKVRQ